MTIEWRDWEEWSKAQKAHLAQVEGAILEMGVSGPFLQRGLEAAAEKFTAMFPEPTGSKHSECKLAMMRLHEWADHKGLLPPSPTADDIATLFITMAEEDLG